MTDTDIIKKYNSICMTANKLKQDKLKDLYDIKDSQLIELDISIRMGHKIEEEFIRYKLELTIDMIDLLTKFKLGIE